MNNYINQVKLSHLKDILRDFSVFSDNYCIGGYSEDCFCILPKEEVVEVFFGKRLEKEELRVYPISLFDDAVEDFLMCLVKEEDKINIQEVYRGFVASLEIPPKVYQKKQI